MRNFPIAFKVTTYIFQEDENDNLIHRRSLKNTKRLSILELEIENAELRLELGSRQLKTKFCICLTSDDNAAPPPRQTDASSVELKTAVVPAGNDGDLVRKIEELEADLHKSQMLLNKKSIALNQVQLLLSEKSLQLAKLKREVMFSSKGSLDSSFSDETLFHSMEEFKPECVSSSFNAREFHSTEELFRQSESYNERKLPSQLPKAKYVI